MHRRWKAIVAVLLPVAAPAAAQDRGMLLAGACQGCHGVSGAGSHGIPPIAGTHRAAEFAAILREFQGDKRPATVMGRIARGYSEEDITRLAAHYAARN